VSVGYFSGDHINSIYDTATRYQLYFAIAVGLVILALIARRLLRWRRARGER
jgi:membrane protein DedA with SNARE-associated domain